MIANHSKDFLDYLEQFSSRDLIELNCPQCDIVFSRSKHDIQSKFGKSNDREKIFCSYECRSKSRETKVCVTCLQCGLKFKKHVNQIIKFPNHFCSSNCSAKYNNSHKTKGYRRSKLESWIELQLTSLFPNLVIKFNDVSELNFELDIYVPSRKLAFELNGIVHYKPIYGLKKFNSVTQNDISKIRMCYANMIDLTVIDVSGMKKFDVQSAQYYLDLIKSKIESKLNAS